MDSGDTFFPNFVLSKIFQLVQFIAYTVAVVASSLRRGKVRNSTHIRPTVG